MNDHNSDLCFVAAAILLGIPIDDLLERSGILEHDGDITRDEANREALFLAMGNRGRRMSREFLDEFFDFAGLALEFEQERGWTRPETNDWVLERMGQRPDTVIFPATERTAV